MRYETNPRFDNDFRALPREDRTQFLDIVADFSVACDNYANDPGGYVWPKRLRVHQMTSVKGIWELTWSFASPDGRATFEFVTVDDEPRVRWRRIG